MVFTISSKYLRENWKPIVGVFVFALAIRCLYLLGSESGPFFSFGGVDSSEYHRMALGFLDGRWPGKEAFFWAPGYSIFLGLIYKFIGNSPSTVKLVQALIGSINCLLVYIIAHITLSKRRIALGAAFACSLCGPLIYFDGQIVPATLDIFVQLSMLFFLIVAARYKGVEWPALAGVCLGCSAVIRGGALLFLPFALFWILRGSGRFLGFTFLKRSLAFLIPIALLVASATWHNLTFDRYENTDPYADRATPSKDNLERFFSGDFVFISSNLGINFYLGNAWELREINNVNHPLCFIYYRNLMEEASTHGIDTHSGSSRFLLNKAFASISKSPWDWIKMMGLKFFRLIGGAEIPRNSNIYAERQYSSILSLLLWKKGIGFPSGILIPLGIVGFFLMRRSWRENLPLFGFILSQWMFVLIFFVTSRYRIATLPILAIFGAHAVHFLLGRIKQRDFKKAALAGVSILLLILVSNLRVGDMDSDHSAFEYNYAAQVLMQQGEVEKALEYYQSALKADPNAAIVHFNLGSFYLQRGDIHKAIEHLKKGLQSAPMDAKAHNTLGSIYASRYRMDDALDQFKAAVEYQPMLPGAHYNLGRIYESRRMPNEAIYHFDMVLKARPYDVEVLMRIATLYKTIGNERKAMDYIETAAKIEPDTNVIRQILMRSQ